ncbi:MAG TPA: hypothetical protein VME68_16410 [Acidobacteriaceae bacterium]|nr:hypothetical protein [Acidobacteriaceae bacterium]
MLRLMEFGLLTVTILIVLGLVLTGPPEAPPVEDPAPAHNGADEAQKKAS